MNKKFLVVRQVSPPVSCFWLWAMYSNAQTPEVWPVSRRLFLCCLGGRKGIRSVKKLSGWVLVWLSVRSAVQTCIWPSGFHCHSLSLASVKSRLVLLFWYRLTRVVQDEGPLNGCVCSCVACIFWLMKFIAVQFMKFLKTWRIITT